MDAGLLITVDVSGRMERMNTRNLPFYAGSFAAYGVPKEKAVQMITLNAAKIIGVADRLGSLTVGKRRNPIRISWRCSGYAYQSTNTCLY